MSTARPTPSPDLLAAIRHMADRETFYSSSIYPYAFGRVQGITESICTPSEKIRHLRELIAAIDIVLAERKP